MKVVQSYQQGAKHISRNQPCEDRTYYSSDNGVDVIALADGAGSQKYTHSAQGAECVTKAICKFFCNHFDKFYEKDDINELKDILTTVCQKQLEKKAEELALDSITRLSSTLLAVAIKDNRVIVCHIGDGVIGKLTPNGLSVVSAPENGEFASTTYFITNPFASKYINISKSIVEDTISYFLMSDGTSEFIYDEFNQCFHSAAQKMARLSTCEDGQEQLEAIIDQYMIKQNPTSDDCSYISISTNNAVETVEIIDNKHIDDVAKENSADKLIDVFNKSNKEFGISNGNKETKTIVNKNSEDKKNNKKVIIIAIAVAVAISCTICISKLTHSKSNSKNETTTQTQIEKSTTMEDTTSNTVKDSTTTSENESTSTTELSTKKESTSQTSSTTALSSNVNNENITKETTTTTTTKASTTNITNKTNTTRENIRRRDV